VIADHRGEFGPHLVQDLPGARCVYRDGQLREVRIRAPLIHAGALSAGDQGQLVGWRYRIEYSTDDATWHEQATSDLRSARASDGRAARLGARRYRFESVSWLRAYRVGIQMSWFMPDGGVGGTADHWIEWYGLIGAGAGAVVAGSVRGELFGD
jgi:hypothetical protein